jgi:pantetheine-phosphate adenylyltransferase
MSTALYPGTFDPFTLGHLDLVARSLKIFDRIIVAVGVNPHKRPLFTAEERVAMIQVATAGLQGVEVDHYSGLTVHYAEMRGIYTIIRSLRTTGEYEVELASVHANRLLDPRVEHVYLMPSPEFVYLSSTVVREIAQFGGDPSPFLPEGVADALIRKLQGM